MKITLQNITFRYDKEPVLNGIDAVFESGEMAALVGPNGSGKSTLIKCINGILKPSPGDVFFDGKASHSLSAAERAIMTGYVPQTEQRSVPIQVFDAVLLGRKPFIHWKPSGSDLEATAAILEQLDLADVAMRGIDTLSGGQLQRVYIARALNQQPAVLLLDEPTANLDLKYQVEILQLLRSLAEKNITVVIAMHDINMAAMFADKVIMLKNGSVFAGGGREIVTAETVEALFGVKVRVIRENGQSVIFPTKTT